jgi:hypothetical protein
MALKKPNGSSRQVEHKHLGPLALVNNHRGFLVQQDRIPG